MTDGPFYPVAFDRKPTTSLIVGPLLAQARPLRLQGRVVDRTNRPVADARVEIWQCDAAQHYRHPCRRRAVRPSTRASPVSAGNRAAPTAAMPSRRSSRWRTPVARRTSTSRSNATVRTLLTSQVFMPDQDALNRADFLWRHLGRDQQPLALATLERSGDRPVAHFDIVVG